MTICKMLWKDVQRIRKGTSGNIEKLKTEDSKMLIENKVVKENGQSILKDY